MMKIEREENDMKKLLLMLVMVVLIGCGAKEVKENIGKESIHMYTNHDKNCLVEIIEKDYDTQLEPKDLLGKVDYCFIGVLDHGYKAEAYDDGKLQTLLDITVKESIKGNPSKQMQIYRDGGKCPLLDYLKLKKTYIDKSKLEFIPENVRGNYCIEIVPNAYFQATLGKRYVFFVKNNMLYQDAYGMLEVIDDKIINVFTNQKYSVHDFQ